LRIYSYIIDRLPLKTNEKFSKQILIYVLGILCLEMAIFFTNHDARFYHNSIAVVTETKVIDKNKSVVIFTIVSLLLVSGKQEKTYVSIISTLLGTFLSLLIAFVVIHLTDTNGLRYGGMEFLTILPQKIFMSQILIGSLGAVMDIAITITSALYELYEKNKTITYRELIKSGKEIGGDIMGAMTNILFFSYISGTIPMILLFLKNGSPLGYTFSMNISLELIRALTGSIGIVLTIPITLYLSALFIYRKGKSL